jgi:hypothetical protein
MDKDTGWILEALLIAGLLIIGAYALFSALAPA